MGVGLYLESRVAVCVDFFHRSLVDDAIVVVENIHRHMTLGGRTLQQAIPAAVDEVGGPPYSRRSR